MEMISVESNFLLKMNMSKYRRDKDPTEWEELKMQGRMRKTDEAKALGSSEGLGSQDFRDMGQEDHVHRNSRG